jgi:hypothetical protein
VPDEPARVALRPREVPAGAPDVDALYAVERVGAVVGFVARDTSVGAPGADGRAGLWFGHFRSGAPATAGCRSRHNAAARLLAVLDGHARAPLVPGTGSLPSDLPDDA